MWLEGWVMTAMAVIFVWFYHKFWSVWYAYQKVRSAYHALWVLERDAREGRVSPEDYTPMFAERAAEKYAAEKLVDRIFWVRKAQKD